MAFSRFCVRFSRHILNCEFHMEQSFTADAFSPDLIFNGLKGEIIDYVISSYSVNVKMIYMYYYRPQLQVHCDNIWNGTGHDHFIHLHKVPAPGIYHAKFVLVTTTEMCRLIVMTANITETIAKNCLNDYYTITVPKCKLACPTIFTTNFYQFLDAFEIKLKSGLLQYDWKGISANLLVSIPRGLSHAMCWRSLLNSNVRFKGEATIRTTTGMLGFNIKKVLRVQKCVFEYNKDWIKDLTKASEHPFGRYDFRHNKEQKTGKDKYELKAIESKPFHYKRYTVEYTRPKKRWLIITSANLSKQAWGSLKQPSVNAELGITWNSKFSFN